MSKVQRYFLEIEVKDNKNINFELPPKIIILKEEKSKVGFYRKIGL